MLNPGRPPLAAPQGRWPAAWSLVRTILRFGRGSLEGEQGEEELQGKLCELHSTIYLQAGGGRRGMQHKLACLTCCYAAAAVPLPSPVLCQGIRGSNGWAVDWQLTPPCLALTCLRCPLFMYNAHCRLRRRCAASGPPWRLPPTRGRGEPACLALLCSASLARFAVLPAPGSHMRCQLVMRLLLGALHLLLHVLAIPTTQAAVWSYQQPHGGTKRRNRGGGGRGGAPQLFPVPGASAGRAAVASAALQFHVQLAHLGAAHTGPGFLVPCDSLARLC